MKHLFKTLSAFLLLSVFCVSAQNVTTPYSMYGYGILGDRATSMQRQMGGVGYAMRSGRQINVMNPASYAAIDSLTYLFDMGIDMDFMWSKEGSAKEHSLGGGLDYLTMQFPIGKYLGGSLGMLPYSSVGYAFGNDIAHGTLENQGNGGITSAYLGVAGKLKGFSVGVNVMYNFGNITNDVFSNPATGGKTLTEHVMKIRDWDINIGLQYGFNITKEDKITIGAAYTPKKSLHGSTWVTKQEITLEQLPVTVGKINLSHNYYSPNMYGGGICFTHQRVSRLNVEADFSLQQWSDALYSPIYSADNPREMIFEGMKFDDRIRYSIGGEYIPNLRGNYVKRMAYRLGGYYCDDYLNVKNNRLREYGVTCGVGLHTPQDKTIVNVGFEWKRRQAHPSALISENYFNITLGVNFNELWFYQRKIK